MFYFDSPVFYSVLTNSSGPEWDESRSKNFGRKDKKLWISNVCYCLRPDFATSGFHDNLEPGSDHINSGSDWCRNSLQYRVKK